MSNLKNIILLSSYELSASAANILFSSIPLNYRDLVLFYSARSTNAALTTLKMRLNSLTTATYNDYNEYSTTTAWVQGGSRTVATTSFDLGIITDSRWASNYFAPYLVQIFGYSSTGVYKNFQSRGSTAPNTTYTADARIGQVYGQNSSLTGQITTVELFPSAGAFSAGSSFYLFAHKI